VGAVRLDGLFNAILTRLELISGTSAKAMGDYTTHAKAAGNSPPRVDTAHALLLRRFEGCNTDDERRLVIQAALEELRSARYARRRGDRGTKQGRLEVGADPRPMSIVTMVYGYSERHVRRCRQEWREEQANSVRRAATMAAEIHFQVVRPEEAHRFTPSPPSATATSTGVSVNGATTEAKPSKQERSSTTAQDSSEAA
jgi:hypothetical protein